MTVPLIRTLQHHLPNTKVYWIISRPMYSLVQGLSNVEFIVLDKPKSLRDFWRCFRHFKSFHFDALLAPQASLRSNFLCSMVRAKVTYGNGRLHSRDGQRLFVNKTVLAKQEHLIDTFLRFAEPFGVTHKIIDWRLPIEQSDFDWAEQQLNSLSGKRFAVCLSASKAERNWPLDRYLKLLDRLARQWNFNVILVGGGSPIEKQIAEQVASKLSMPHLNLMGKSTLKQLAAVLSRVDALLSPDTGPLHIATAMRIPVVGLYAVAPPEKTGPYFSQEWVVNRFPEAVRRILKRDPNKISWRKRVHSAQAMELITVDDVEQKCVSLFSRLGFTPTESFHPGHQPKN